VKAQFLKGKLELRNRIFRYLNRQEIPLQITFTYTGTGGELKILCHRKNLLKDLKPDLPPWPRETGRKQHQEEFSEGKLKRTPTGPRQFTRITWI
jgi:hypothetical protein